MSNQAALEKIVHELQVVSQQVAAIQSQIREIKGTIEYIETHDVNRPIYHQVGPLLIETENISKLLGELQESHNHLSKHLASLQERESELHTSYESISQEFEKS